jgi:hypothetical protein
MADLYTFTLIDGTVERYTSIDEDITWNGDVYYSKGLLLERSTITQKRGVEVDELEIDAKPVDATIGGIGWLAAVRNGALDGAQVKLQRLFFKEVQMINENVNLNATASLAAVGAGDTLLDNFNRPNADPIGGNWTALGPFSFRIVSHQLQVSAGRPAGMSYWNPTTFGLHSQVYITVAALASTDEVNLTLCLTHPGLSQNNYSLNITNGDTWQMTLIIGGAVNADTSDTWVQAVSPGDKVGFANVDGVLTAYYCPLGGSWAVIGTWDVATLEPASHALIGDTGYIGLVGLGTPIFDDFGGGNIP